MLQVAPRAGVAHPSWHVTLPRGTSSASGRASARFHICGSSTMACSVRRVVAVRARTDDNRIMPAGVPVGALALTTAHRAVDIEGAGRSRSHHGIKGGHRQRPYEWGPQPHHRRTVRPFQMSTSMTSDRVVVLVSNRDTVTPPTSIMGLHYRTASAAPRQRRHRRRRPHRRRARRCGRRWRHGAQR